MTTEYDASNDPAMVRFPFGKYRGEAIRRVPSGYLMWCFEECEKLRPRLRRLIQRELAERIGFKAAPPRDRPLLMLPDPDVREAAHALIGAGYRAAAKRLHPDAGGDHSSMIYLGAARDWLTRVLEGVA